jgi:hypothetical protein
MSLVGFALHILRASAIILPQFPVCRGSRGKCLLVVAVAGGPAADRKLFDGLGIRFHFGFAFLLLAWHVVSFFGAARMMRSETM